VSNLRKTKKIDFTTWRGKDFSVSRDYATVTDDNGNEYKRMDFGFKAIKKYGFQGAQNYENEASIYPQESFEDLLVFEKPVENRKWLHLELPASNFGGTGMVRFEIPASNETNQDNSVPTPATQASQDVKPMTFQQGNIAGKINDVVVSSTTGESPTERGLIVTTRNFLLVEVSLSNTGSNRICDYTTFRDGAVLTDDKGNTYRKIDSKTTVDTPFGPVDGWAAPKGWWAGKDNFRAYIFVNSCRIQPHNGQDDMLAFYIPDSPGNILYLELPAANFDGTGKIRFEIPVSRIKNW
jgi:hypothetical protein